MANIITGDINKGIRRTGELSLRISKYDSYRLFTLYENVGERKLMNVSGSQKYYLVFKSPKNEIRIPEYEPNGFFEVDKANGCILFKITKKNAEDILGMKTGGENIFHIVRTYEERDAFGRVLSVTDEVEVFNGKWGDDATFNSYSTENKVEFLTNALATQVNDNAKLREQIVELRELYNAETVKAGDLEKENEKLKADLDKLQEQLNEYTSNTYDGTVLSTDSHYVILESALNNVEFTEDQIADAVNDALAKNSGVELETEDKVYPKLKLNVEVYGDGMENATIYIEKNGITIGSAVYGNPFIETVNVVNDDAFEFVCTGFRGYMQNGYEYERVLLLDYDKSSSTSGKEYIKIDKVSDSMSKNKSESIVMGTVNFGSNEPVDIIGELKCYAE